LRVRLRFSGQPLGDELSDTGIQTGRIGRMLLSNHISWIDIFAINAVMPCRFVAKAEIVRWPVIGGMLAHSGTLFIERGRRSAVATMNEVVQGHLRPEKA
jgi:1-acyl-sn-glycerol-3-phosphate acyltransferase